MCLPHLGPKAWRHNADFTVSWSGKHRAALVPQEDGVRQQPGSRATPTEAESRQIWSSRCVFVSPVVSLTQPSLIKPFSSHQLPFHLLPLPQLLQQHNRGWRVSHGEILIHRPIPHAMEEYAVTPLPAVSQGTGRGETSLPAPAACLPLSCPPCRCCGDLPWPTEPQRASTFPGSTSSLSVSPLHQTNSFCVPLQLWVFFKDLDILAQISPVFKGIAGRREDLCLAGWGFTNFYKQLKTEAFNRKGHPTLRGSAALQKSPHKLAGMQPLVPPAAGGPRPAAPSLPALRGAT